MNPDMEMDQVRQDYIRKLQMRRAMGGMAAGNGGNGDDEDRPRIPIQRQGGLPPPMPGQAQDGLRRPLNSSVGPAGAAGFMPNRGNADMRQRGLNAANGMVPPVPTRMMGNPSDKKQFMTAEPDEDDGPVNNMYYLSRIVQSIVVIILLAGLFFIPRNLSVLWLIIFGLLFLSSVGLEIFGSWITLSKNTDDGKQYEDAAKYILYTITIMFASVFIALLIFFAWRLIVIVRDVVERRKTKLALPSIPVVTPVTSSLTEELEAE